MLTNVDRLLAQPPVSGQITMSATMMGGIDDALVRLHLMNQRKYAAKERAHFYRYHTIMVLFAKLVATIIILTKMPNDGQYHQTVTEPRRRAVIAFWIDQLDRACVWDAAGQCFRPATEAQAATTAAAKRQRLMDAYNPSAWLDKQ